ncbi:MAG: HEPN family nuclease [Hyphomicrobiaceae bacterium]
MPKKDLAQERDAVDMVTDCMYSLDYLRVATDVIFSDKRNNVTVGRFYDEWLKATGSPRVIMPFNPGVLLAYLYVGILFAKEGWFDLLPADQIKDSDEAWGLKGASVSSPKEANPTIRYAVRRMRNSLGHGHPIFFLPDGTKKEELFAKATFSFHDVNMRDQADTFDIALTLDQLASLVKKFQSVVHAHVREKK